MSTPLPLDSLSISRSSRQLLQRAGFHTREDVICLKPTQLAQELNMSPSAAHALLKQLREARWREREEEKEIEEEEREERKAREREGNGEEMKAENDNAPASEDERKSQPIQSKLPQPLAHPSQTDPIPCHSRIHRTHEMGKGDCSAR